jgi:lysophospholipase L1-like esterase
MLPVILSPDSKLFDNDYAQSLIRLFGPSMISAWSLEERKGLIAKDIRNIKKNGTVSNAVLGNTIGIDVNKTAPLFVPASNSNINIFSSTLASEINLSQLTFFIWVKAGTGLWADTSTSRMITNFYIDANNYIQIMHNNVANGLRFVRKWANNWAVVDNTANYTDWFLYTCIIDKINNKQKTYLNTENTVSTNVAYGGDMVGTLSSAYIGAFNPGNLNIWNGNLCYGILINRVATVAEISSVFNLAPNVTKYKTITILGDSISANTSIGWQIAVKSGYNDNRVTLKNWAVSGAHIMSDYTENLTKQVGQAASDIAHNIIIELGTNDNNSGDMTALQAKIVSQVSILKTSNPQARIFYMNVLPRFDGVDKSNIRIAVTSACATAGITCWDTNTIPWITSTDVVADNLHPNASGYAKITAQVLARI